MIIYSERPTQRRARKAWDFFAAAHPGKQLRRVWKNANCWGTPQPVGNAWGFWVAEYWDGTFENATPSEF